MYNGIMVCKKNARVGSAICTGLDILTLFRPRGGGGGGILPASTLDVNNFF